MAEQTFQIADELEVRRMGFGAMRVCGQGVWGPPDDRDAAIALLRRVPELGINLIDTADAYGPEVSENLLADALHPYTDLVIATKGGLTRGGPGDWQTNGRPEHLTAACEASLKRLRVDCIDLYQLHAVDDDVPLEDSVGALQRLQEAGKVRFVGLSNVSVDELARARGVVDVVSVQNKYNLGFRTYDDVLDACTEAGIAFLPWYPLDASGLADGGGALSEVAADHGSTAAQIALAWLMHRAPNVLPIPGTSSIAHLEENTSAQTIVLTPSQQRALDAAL